jgi:hypothetical protein
MRSAWRLLLLLAALAPAGRASASVAGRAGPLLVSFAGTFEPYDERQLGKLRALTIHVRGQRWRFEVADVHTVGGPESGWSLLDHIFPPVLRFMGREEDLAPLADPGVAGRHLTVVGWLYLGTGRFYVASESNRAPGSDGARSPRD